MMWVALAVAVVLVGLTVAAVLGRVDGSLVEPTSTSSYVPLPSDPLSADDLASIRLDTGFRGYRMDQVNDGIDRLAAEITRLRGGDPKTAPPVSPPAVVPVVPVLPETPVAVDIFAPPGRVVDPPAVDPS